ncbi:MAG TPA: class I SAM-dependent methyltransferase [Candidatus Angelobacter sp.]|nr:class I SAM-dependent methyltransferase [Candidatus Angelobacter sp.]
MSTPESEEKTRWDSRYSEHPESWTEPDEFLQQSWDEYLSGIPAGVALDLAGGAGRNTVFLLQRGWQVKLIDISKVGISLAKEKAREISVTTRLTTEIADINDITDLGANRYDLITVFFFLRRELFPALIRALKRGGFLIYKTYTIDRANAAGGPGDTKYLLQPNELLREFSALRILHYHESLTGKVAAALVAQKQ